MSVVQSHEFLRDDGDWLRSLLTAIQDRMRMLPPDSTVERIRRKVATGIAGRAVESKAA